MVTYLAKTVASICFVAAGFLAAMLTDGPKPLILLMLGGLVFGMLGDIFLCRVHIARGRILGNFAECRWCILSVWTFVLFYFLY